MSTTMTKKFGILLLKAFYRLQYFALIVVFTNRCTVSSFYYTADSTRKFKKLYLITILNPEIVELEQVA